MMIRRTLAVLATAAALVLVGAGAASAAGNPHFIASGTSASASGTTLTVKFKEAGLSAGTVVVIEATAHLDAEYSCVNNGKKVPSDPKKTTVSSDLSSSGEFTVPKNGNLTGSLELNAPAPSTALSCPPGQTATLISVVWTNVKVMDNDSGAFLNIPGTF